MDSFDPTEHILTNHRLFSHNNYTRDLLKHYGDRGRPMHVPKLGEREFQQAMQFRNREKQQYADLESELRAARAEAAAVRKQLQESEKEVDYFAKFVNDYLTPQKEEDDRAHRGRGDGDSGGDGRDRPLPAQDRPGQDDTHDGADDALISSKKATTNESSNNRVRRSRRDNAGELDTVETSGALGTQRAEPAGGAPPDAPDGPEPDVGGPSGEHGAEE